MNAERRRSLAKRAMGGLPLAAEVYQNLWAGKRIPATGYELDRLMSALPAWCEAARLARRRDDGRPGKRVLVFGSLKWWLEYACALAVTFASMGHEVHLAYLPYRRWAVPVPRFDARRQSAYLRRALHALNRLVHLLDFSPQAHSDLPDELISSMHELSLRDVQYTVQREDLDLEPGSEDETLYRLRLARNLTAARHAYATLQGSRFDVVVVPNGSILEFGAVFRTAQHLGLRAVTYEFGEQRERLWLAQDAEVMRHDTSELWRARGGASLTESERRHIEELMAARRGGKVWGQFARQWQAAPSAGAQATARSLGLDPSRPVALLCTNVVGDSLALGRQVFTRGMADWLALTVRTFAARPQAQLVVRVHPGELLGAGHPSTEIVQSALPEFAPHVIVVPPDSSINTYDLIELADLGLVYTTTVGLEMAMAGVPVVVAGQTHYRGRGFTTDPESEVEYLGALDAWVGAPKGRRLPPEQVELAWRYAHRFFFEFPQPFPWHLVHFWDDVAARPVEAMVSPEARAPYQATFDALLGEPVKWHRE